MAKPLQTTPGSLFGKMRTSAPQTDKPKTPSPRDAKKFSFGLKYWKQYKNFGLSNADTPWFVSLLERLQTMEALRVEEIRFSGSDSFRCHLINWEVENIPIQKSDFVQNGWLAENFFEDNDFYQFQVSQAKGRVIGFFDENYVFQIVLLDRNHNAQPSKDNGYKITKNAEEYSEHENLLRAVSRSIEACRCKMPSCDNLKSWEKIAKKNFTDAYDNKHIVIVGFSDEIWENFRQKCCRHQGMSLEDILELGLDACLDPP